MKIKIWSVFESINNDKMKQDRASISFLVKIEFEKFKIGHFSQKVRVTTK